MVPQVSRPVSIFHVIHFCTMNNTILPAELGAPAPPPEGIDYVGDLAAAGWCDSKGTPTALGTLLLSAFCTPHRIWGAVDARHDDSTATTYFRMSTVDDTTVLAARAGLWVTVTLFPMPLSHKKQGELVEQLCFPQKHPYGETHFPAMILGLDQLHAPYEGVNVQHRQALKKLDDSPQFGGVSVYSDDVFVFGGTMSEVYGPVGWYPITGADGGEILRVNAWGINDIADRLERVYNS